MNKKEEVLEAIGLSYFPAFEVALKASVRLLHKEMTDNRAIAELVRLDPGLVQLMLKRGNSAVYGGFSGKVDTPEKALYLMGHDEVLHSLTAHKVLSSFIELKQTPILRQALGTTLIASLLATGLMSSKQGLLVILRNLAEILIANKLPAVYCRFLQESRSHRTECAFFGDSLLELSRAIVAGWNLPKSITGSMLDHSDLDFLEDFARSVWHSGMTSDNRKLLLKDYSELRVAPVWASLSNYVKTNHLLDTLREASPISRKETTRLASDLADLVALIADETRHGEAKDRVKKLLIALFGLEHVHFILRDLTKVNDSLPYFRLEGDRDSSCFIGRGACLFNKASASNAVQVLEDGKRKIGINPLWHVNRFPHVRGMVVIPMPKGKGFIYGGSKQKLVVPADVDHKLLQTVANQISMIF